MPRIPRLGSQAGHRTSASLLSADRLILTHQTRPPQEKRGIIPQQHVIQNSLWAFTLQIFQYTFQQNEDDDANDCDQKSKYKAV